MKNVYTYYDGNTHTKCSRKLAVAFLIAQNGGQVRRNGVRVAWIDPTKTYLYTTPSRYRKGTDAFKITPEMRQAAQEQIAKFVKAHKPNQCDNCSKRWSNDEVILPIPHLEQRVDEDGPEPSGECPECGALCYDKSSAA